MNARSIWVLYLHELRSALRERNIVVYSLLIPAILYPLLIWLTWTAVTFVGGQNESQSSRIVLPALPAELQKLDEQLRHEPQFEIFSNSIEFEGKESELLREGRADAVLRLEHQEGDPNPRLVLLFDGSKDRSRLAKTRVMPIIERAREQWLEKTSRELGIAPSQWTPFRADIKNEASGRDMGAFLLKLVVPLLLLIMTAMGCFYPAVDAIAGERERNTWETLMASAAGRPSILLAKYFYVATFGCAAGLLNLLGIGISLTAIVTGTASAADTQLHLSIPPSAVPLMILCTLLIALFIAAVMLILASFARTFKEGQAMITPFYFTISLPALLLQSPDLELSSTIACIPLANVTVLFRDALSGNLNPRLIGLTLAVQLVSIAACLWIGRRLLRFEDFLAGASKTTFKKILRKGIFGS